MSARENVLARLRGAQGVPLSGTSLARDLGLSRAAVWKHVRSLRAVGYEISGEPGTGYVLRAAPDLLLPAELGRRSGSVHHFLTLDSTNDEARRLGLEGAPEGILVVAEEQGRGRGRRGRRWSSPRGGIYLSLLLRPGCHPAEASRLTLVAAVAVAEATEVGTGLPARIKWPNDVLVSGRKVCGILLEMVSAGDAVDFVVVGIGVNVNNFVEAPAGRGVEATEPPISGATSLAAELGRPLDRVWLTNLILERLEASYADFLAGRWPVLLERWRARCDTLGRRVCVTWGTPGATGDLRGNDGEAAVAVREGVAADVDADGALLLDEDGGRRLRLLAGDVTLRSVP